jgi:CspA family cold shock protein
MNSGTVKWFNAAKGYGCISNDNGSGECLRAFFGNRGKGFKSLQEGQKVTLTANRSEKQQQDQSRKRASGLTEFPVYS